MARLTRRRPSAPSGATTAEARPSERLAQRAEGLPIPQFKHVVVVMFEGRSFDNLLGLAYDSRNPPPRGQSFEGVDGKSLSNPRPASLGGGAVALGLATTGAMPAAGPSPAWQHVNTQLFGEVSPAANFGVGSAEMLAPYNLPAALPDPAPMNGFVIDYASRLQAQLGRAPTEAEYSPIMTVIPPARLPNFNTFARQFAVCDHWFCSVPSETWPNRSFFQAGQSSGFTVNAPYSNFGYDNTATTIFDRLHDAGLPWRVYYDLRDGFSLTKLIHFQQLGALKYYFNFKSMRSFYEDVRDGTLPAYSFIEPRLLYRPNDAQPPADVVPADQLLGEVYAAIRDSRSTIGSNFQNTLLIATFDEHGGTYDHVPPPQSGPLATPPLPAQPAGQLGFGFDRLGPRVPAVLISAFIEAGTVVSTPLTHTSVIRTLCDQWGLEHLTERDRSSPSLAAVFNRSVPREAADWPAATDHGPAGTPADNLDRPLSAPQADIVGLASMFVPPRAPIATVRDAVGFLYAAGPQLGFHSRETYLPIVLQP